MSSEKEVANVSETVSMRKYYLEGENWKTMSSRVGYFIASAEKNKEDMQKYAEIFSSLIENKEFIPGGRILANAGTYFDKLNTLQREFLSRYINNFPNTEKRCGQMLNCYVIPVKDSKHGPGSIYESIEDAADITAMEGGIGENFSFLRPKNFPIAGNERYKASGPVSFLKVFNSSGEELSQGGGRRDANMAVLNCDHPDIFEFVNCKRNEGTIKSYNISVGIYDAFMDAVAKNSTWDLKWNGKVVQTIQARDLFDNIVHNIWADGGGGEPGVLFLDTAKKTWPFSNEDPITTNPCGEQFLGFYEACDLGALNLFKFVEKNRSDGMYIFNKTKFKQKVKQCIRFLDNVLDLNNYPLKYRDDICEKISMKHRRIGLGIMGFADVLMALGIRYGSEKSIEFINDIMSIFDAAANEESFALGMEKGAFLDQENAESKFRGRRNCATTTIAPTGTTSMVAEVAGGCEPHFGLVVKKKTTDGSGLTYYMVPDSFKMLFAQNDIELSNERLEEIYNNGGSVDGLSWVPRNIQEVLVTTMDIHPLEHVAVQCAFQKHIENSISKTINLKKDALKSDVEDCIFALWHGGAKGGTLYRDGSRNLQIMNVGGSEKKNDLVSNHSIMSERPRVLEGKTFKVTSKITHNAENIYITVNEDIKKNPVEIFVHHSGDQSVSDLLDFMIHNGVKPDIAQMLCSKIIQTTKENVTLTTRLISLCLRNNVGIHDIVKQLNKISSADLYSLHKHLAKILGSYIPKDFVAGECDRITDNGEICRGRVVYQEGCAICTQCKYSKCG